MTTLWRSIPSAIDTTRDEMLAHAVVETAPGTFERVYQWFPAQAFVNPDGSYRHSILLPPQSLP